MQRFGLRIKGHGSLKQRTILALGTFVALVWAACAAKRDFTEAKVPAWDFVKGMVLEPPNGLSEGEQRRFAEGWKSLQQGNLEQASSELERLRKRYGGSPEVATAYGFFELRLGNSMAAERYFKAALKEQPEYAPAESGSVLTALATSDEERAYERLVKLREDYPQHPLVDRYLSTLQVNLAEKRLSAARNLMQQGRYKEASDVYLRALDVAPEVGGLYLETAEAELAAGLTARAVVHARKATELEPEEAPSYRLLGEAQYAAGDLEGAFEAYRVASSLAPRDGEVRQRLEAIEAEYEAGNVPPQYLRIAGSDRLTREQFAALLYIELREAFEAVPERTSVIATDIGDSWARDFIRHVVGVGVLEVFPNHTFQPRAFVRRVDLAKGLAAALEILSPATLDALKQSSRFEQDFSDLSADNPNYEAASLCVSLGLLLPQDGAKFAPRALVSGRDAVSAVEALAAHMTP